MNCNVVCRFLDSMILSKFCLPENTKVKTVKLIGLDELVQLESNIPGQGIPQTLM